MEQSNSLPEDVDLNRASAARMYDYFLGGAHNFAVDRELGREVIQEVPGIKNIAINNRAFLRRAVEQCLQRGIRQFIDIGSGIPTVGNVHEIAQRTAPDARVVYVDNEPVAVAHSRAILEGNDNADIIHADLADINEILDAPATRRLIDLNEPVAVMMVALIHFVPDSAEPKKIVHDYADRMAPGSYLCLSHATGDDHPDKVKPLVELYSNSSNPLTLRSRQDTIDMLADFVPIDPGVVYIPEWHPDVPQDAGSEPSQSILYAGVGRKP